MTEPQQLSLIPSDDYQKWKPVRDDFNFCRLALFVASDKRPDRFRDIEQLYKFESGGNVVEASWKVRHDPTLGLPGSFDRDVWLGLMELVTELTDGQRKPVPKKIQISSHREFLRRLGKPHSGRYQKLLKDSLRRLTVTMCLTEKSFNCPSSGGYLQLLKPIHLIDGCAFKGEPDNNGNLHESTWIELGEYVRKNLENGYIALLDVSYIRSLKGDIAKQLYPLLSYRFWLATQRGRDFTSMSWREIGEYLAAVGWDTAPRAKQRLKPALEELKLRGYIDPTSDWQDDVLVLRIGDKFIDEMRSRLNAKDAYQRWSSGKVQVRQLSCLTNQDNLTWNVPPGNIMRQVTDAEEREIVLIRQATRVALFSQQPDEKLLAKHGWTPADAISLAQTIQAPR